jgi:tripartite-type tricarboxylate transporter receptor subunit TctC
MAAAAAPDGYTLLFCNSPTHSVNPAMVQNLGYDVETDFAPIARTAIVPFILAVNPTLPVRSVGDLVKLSKAKPGTLRYGSAGPATITHIGGELLASKAGIKLLHVPYKGLAPAITDVIGGHIDMLFMTPREGLPHVRTGRLRALAVTSERRLAVLPEIPTMDESGLKGAELLAWAGLCAPRGTPAAVVRRLNAEAMAAYLSPSVKNELEREGFELVANTPEEFAQFMRADKAYIAALVKQLDIRADE